MKQLTFFLATSSYALAGIPAAPPYSADFNNTIGYTHTASSPLAPGPQVALGPNWEIGYNGTPSTDTTSNTFGTDGSALASDDWGGEGYFETSLINVFGIDNINISGIGATVSPEDTDVFNAGGENFQWFYSLDGIKTYGDLIASNGSLNTDASWNNIDASGASSLTVGFEFDINGADTGFSISSVDVTLVPEPGTYALLAGACALGFVMLRRRS